MKKLFIFGALASAVVFSSAVSANSGTINFTGTITSATCAINPVVNGGVANAINLGTSDTTLGGTAVTFALTPAGAGAADCLAKTAADVSWNGPNMDPAGFANSGGSAKGVSLQLKATNSDNTGELVTDSNRVIVYGAKGGSSALKTFDYEASLVSSVSGGTASAGSFVTSASYTVAYK